MIQLDSISIHGIIIIFKLINTYNTMCCAMLSRSVLSNSLRPHGSSVHGDSPGKNTGVGCHALLQGIFPTHGSNPGLLHCRQIVYCLSHQGSP